MTPREFRLAVEGFLMSRGVKPAAAGGETPAQKMARYKALHANPEPEVSR